MVSVLFKDRQEDDGGRQTVEREIGREGGRGWASCTYSCPPTHSWTCWIIISLSPLFLCSLHLQHQWVMQLIQLQMNHASFINCHISFWWQKHGFNIPRWWKNTHNKTSDWQRGDEVTGRVSKNASAISLERFLTHKCINLRSGQPLLETLQKSLNYLTCADVLSSFYNHLYSWCTLLISSL